VIDSKLPQYFSTQQSVTNEKTAAPEPMSYLCPPPLPLGTLSFLPANLVELAVLKWLEPEELVVLVGVCRAFRRLAQEETIWRQKVLRETFPLPCPYHPRGWRATWFAISRNVHDSSTGTLCEPRHTTELQRFHSVVHSVPAVSQGEDIGPVMADLEGPQLLNDWTINSILSMVSCF
jgi:hypothetical protein